MINELYELAEAMDRAAIEESIPARNFPLLAEGGKCICVIVNKGDVTRFYEVDRSTKKNIHKYGATSKGFYPCVNLASLYKITDKNFNTLLKAIKETPSKLNDDELLNQIVAMCSEDHNNWDKKAVSRCRRSIDSTAKELRDFLKYSPYTPLQILAEETDYFLDPMRLHEALTKAALKELKQKENVDLALSLLFDYSKSLYILFDTDRLYEYGTSVVSSRFSQELNSALLRAEQASAELSAGKEKDAFNLPYSPTEEVMPEIRLGAGFSVKLRAMNINVNCLHRYGFGGSYSYPASVEIRQRLSKALTYISKKDNQNKTWITIEKVWYKEKWIPYDVMFAYPLELNEIPQNFANVFHGVEDQAISFESRAEQCLSALKTPRRPGVDSYADGIRIFVLRRVDYKNQSGRTKVVYTRQTDPYELEKQSETWSAGCMNLPSFPFGQPSVPFPLEAADILNRFWKQNGESITDTVKPIHAYHGLELLMDSDFPITADLHCLAEKAMALGAFLGTKLAKGELNHPIWGKIKGMPELMGLLLYRKGIGKDTYMESLPYLYGQLLKVSDELHALYCAVVRGGELPTQLAGGILYQAAADAPIRTLNLLGQRMNPYILWAKSYRTKNVAEKGKESWRAGWLISLYEKTASALYNAWSAQTRFNDEEKALLFLGYLASFPKREQIADGTEKINYTEEENINE